MTRFALQAARLLVLSLALLVLTAGAVAAQPQDEWRPIGDRVTLGGALGPALVGDSAANYRAMDTMMRVELPIAVTTRLRFETGHAFARLAKVPYDRPELRPKTFNAPRASVAFVRVVEPPRQVDRDGRYFGGGVGVYDRRAENEGVHAGLYGIAGFEHVLRGDRRAVTVEGQVHLTGADHAENFGMIAALSLGMKWRY